MKKYIYILAMGGLLLLPPEATCGQEADSLLARLEVLYQRNERGAKTKAVLDQLDAQKDQLHTHQKALYNYYYAAHLLAWRNIRGSMYYIEKAGVETDKLSTHKYRKLKQKLFIWKAEFFAVSKNELKSSRMAALQANMRKEANELFTKLTPNPDPEECYYYAQYHRLMQPNHKQQALWHARQGTAAAFTNKQAFDYYIFENYFLQSVLWRELTDSISISLPPHIDTTQIDLKKFIIFHLIQVRAWVKGVSPSNNVYCKRYTIELHRGHIDAAIHYAQKANHSLRRQQKVRSYTNLMLLKHMGNWKLDTAHTRIPNYFLKGAHAARQALRYAQHHKQSSLQGRAYYLITINYDTKNLRDYRYEPDRYADSTVHYFKAWKAYCDTPKSGENHLAHLSSLYRYYDSYLTFIVHQWINGHITEADMLNQRKKYNSLKNDIWVQFEKQNAQQYEYLLAQSMEYEQLQRIRKRSQTIRGILIVALIALLLIISYTLAQRRLNRREKKIILQEARVNKKMAELKGQADERKKMAQQLHDEIANVLAALQYRLDNLSGSLLKKSNIDYIGGIKEKLSHTYYKIRNFSHLLNIPDMEQHDFASILENLFEENNRVDGITVSYSIHPPEAINNLDPKLKHHVFLLLQEMILNVLKHAEATQINATLFIQDGALTIIFEDNGIGTDADTIAHGFTSLKDRTSLTGGELHINSTKDYGTSMTLEIPVTPA